MKNTNNKGIAFLKVALKVIGAIAGAAIMGLIIVLADAYELPKRMKTRFDKCCGKGKRIAE